LASNKGADIAALAQYVFLHCYEPINSI